MKEATVTAHSTVQIGELELGSGRTAVIVPLTGATEAQLLDQAQSAGEHRLAGRIDLIEWRVDLLHDNSRSPEQLIELAARVRSEAGDRPLLATVRTRAEGGSADVDDSQYLDLVRALSSSPAVDAVDVEHRRTTAASAVQAAQSAGTTAIASHHDFQSTPPTEQLLDHLHAMAQTGAEILKMAVMPRSPQDVLTLLDTTLHGSHELRQPLITMSMGPLGVASRLSGGLFGSAATFASLGEVSAPGQLPLETVIALLDAQRPQQEDPR